MKTYEILVKAYTTIIVEAVDEEAALEVASNEIRQPSGWELDEWSVDEELRTPEDVASSIKHSPYHQDKREEDPFR